jgi:hypothetical protein
MWYRKVDPENDNTASAPFSYANSLNSNEFTAMSDSSIPVFVRGSSASSACTINDRLWHHLVVSWHQSSKRVRIYTDGALCANVALGISAGTPRNNGVLIFGQGACVRVAPSLVLLVLTRGAPSLSLSAQSRTRWAVASRGTRPSTASSRRCLCTTRG